MNTIAIGQPAKVTSNTVSIGAGAAFNWETRPSAERQLKDANARIDKLEAAMALMQEQFEKVWYAPGMPGAAEAKEDFEERTK